MEKTYKRKGFVGQAVNAISGLVAGVGVAIMVLILVGVLSGKTYQLNEASIDNISDSTIKTNIKNSITSGFQALEDTGSYMGVIVVTIVIVLVLALVMGIQGTTNSGQRGGSAL